MKAEYYLTAIMTAMVIAGQGQTNSTAMEKRQTTLTCKLTTPQLKERKTTVIAELKARVVERVELADGYRYTFMGSDENLDKLTEFIKTERMCCDFFTFQITVEEDMINLTISGPEAAKAFLKEEIDL